MKGTKIELNNLGMENLFGFRKLFNILTYKRIRRNKILDGTFISNLPTVTWNKGKKGIFSQESIQKIKEARKKQIFTEETARLRSYKGRWLYILGIKLNKGLKGKENPFFGKKHSQESLRKISENTKLSMRRPEVSKKVSEASKKRKGNKAANWKGGIAYLPYSGNFNKKFKALIKLRDYCCIVCGSSKVLSIHHIDYYKLNTTKENCVTLCNKCNTKANFNRTSWTKFFRNYLSEKFNYNYNFIIMEDIKND